MPKSLPKPEALWTNNDARRVLDEWKQTGWTLSAAGPSDETAAHAVVRAARDRHGRSSGDDPAADGATIEQRGVSNA
jgi:hypothetical protein